jgi:hypothetical protein
MKNKLFSNDLDCTMFKKGGFLDHLEGFLVGRGMFQVYTKNKEVGNPPKKIFYQCFMFQK